MFRLGSSQTLSDDVFEDYWLFCRGFVIVLKLTHEDETRDVDILEFFVAMALTNNQEKCKESVLVHEELRLQVFAC